ncbi:MAG: sigma-70 domain-containing protein [Gemmataceae bacterium]
MSSVISCHPISLDRPVGESEDSFFGEFIEDDSAAESPVSAATQEMLKDKIDHVLKTLTYREREIISFRYGLGMATPTPWKRSAASSR